MLKLNARLPQTWEAEPFVARLRAAPASGGALAGAAGEIHILNGTGSPSRSFSLEASRDGQVAIPPDGIRLPAAMDYLRDGDILRISPRVGEVWVLYRRASRFNALLLTEQCNSECLMCSQPPKTADDRFLVDTYLAAIPLMDRDTPELGITGGEPTLLGDRLLQIVEACRDELPGTALHMLSNGRMFQYLELCRDLAAVRHPDLMIGIPLYSDLAHRHDFVVQAEGAFDQTVRGLLNLARCGVRIEIRVVLHRQTIDRLPDLARFLARNLPFVEHVALMGLEMMGYVRMNLEALWIDPVDYQRELAAAVRLLTRHGLRTSIYNHPLCLLDRELWPYARQSISDWKQEYLEECRSCAARDQCGGLFASSQLRRSPHIRPVADLPFSPAGAAALDSEPAARVEAGAGAGAVS